MSSSSRSPPRDRSTILSEIAEARSRLAQLELELESISSTSQISTSSRSDNSEASVQSENNRRKEVKKEWPLSLREYQRYGRQMLISPIGLPGQLKLKNSHILVVGAGGLGCPVLLYLAAAGVGEITIVDHDTVELSNLHRQVLHSEAKVGMSKAFSAKLALSELNSDIKINAHQLPFNPSLFHSHSTTPSCFTSSLAGNGRKSPFTLVLDCTDNPATRHFLNSYCVAIDTPLVSGGAVRAEGTVGVYGLPITSQEKKEDMNDERGPCYACIFPPPPTSSSDDTTSTPTTTRNELRTELERDLEAQRASLVGTGACSDEGVLGINCGVVGLGMAAEAIKVILGIAKPTLHLFAPLSPSPYRTIKTRPRKPNCSACGNYPSSSIPSSSSSSSSTSTQSTPQSRWKSFLDSPDGTWPGWEDPLCELPSVADRAEREGRRDERLRVDELKRLLAKGGKEEGEVKIVDTRPMTEFGIVNIDGSINIPFPRFLKDPSIVFDELLTSSDSATSTTIAFICRRGNDSLLASRALQRWQQEHQEEGEEEVTNRRRQIRIVDVAGGLTAWAKEEEGFPLY